MNLKLEKNKVLEPKSGDILVFKVSSTNVFEHYLIVEDKPKGQFTLLNMSSNCLMSSVTTHNVKSIVSDAVRRFYQLSFDGIISSDEYEVRRVN